MIWLSWYIFPLLPGGPSVMLNLSQLTIIERATCYYRKRQLELFYLSVIFLTSWQQTPAITVDYFTWRSYSQISNIQHIYVIFFLLNQYITITIIDLLFSPTTILHPFPSMELTPTIAISLPYDATNIVVASNPFSLI